MFFLRFYRRKLKGNQKFYIFEVRHFALPVRNRGIKSKKNDFRKLIKYT